MPYSEIDFMGQSDAQYLTGRDDTIVISIRDSHSEPARISKGFKDVLFLEFDNTDVLSHRFIRFSLKPAQNLLDFVAKHEGQATRIVVNCMMGESRSAAVARYLAQKYSVELTKSSEKYSDWVFHVLTRVDERGRLAQARQATVPTS
jgi:predicted protein tyrosine phosphatase